MMLPTASLPAAASSLSSPLLLPPSLTCPIQLPMPPQSPPFREPIPVPSVRQAPFREPLPVPPVLWDTSRSSQPYPPADENLRAGIEDRFMDAYAAQIGYLQHAAQEEMITVEADIGRLRNLAWAAQKSASEQARRAEVARAALREREEESLDVRQALARAHEALRNERAVLAESRTSLERTEWEHAEATARASQEVADMQARLNAMIESRTSEQQLAVDLEQRLVTARSEREAEAMAAREQAWRGEAAVEATKQAKAGLAWRDSVAEQTLRDAVQRLEADFARERADIVEQDRRGLARVQAIERDALKEQWGATVGRAVSRPQAAANQPSLRPAASTPQMGSRWGVAQHASQRMGMLPQGQVVVAARS